MKRTHTSSSAVSEEDDASVDPTVSTNDAENDDTTMMRLPKRLKIGCAMKDIPFRGDHIPGLIGKAALPLPDCCDDAVVLSQAVIRGGYAFCSQECANYTMTFLKQYGKLEEAQTSFLSGHQPWVDWFPSYGKERRNHMVVCERCDCNDQETTYYCTKLMIDNGYRFRDGVCALCAKVLIANKMVEIRWGDSPPSGWWQANIEKMDSQRCVHQGSRCCGMMWDGADNEYLCKAYFLEDDAYKEAIKLWCASCMEDQEVQERQEWWNGGGVCAMVKEALLSPVKEEETFIIAPLFDIISSYLVSSYTG